MRILAWTGGSRPAKFLCISELERKLRRLIFRNAIQARKAFWGRLDLDHARACYIEGRYNAHATLRDSNNGYRH